MTMANSRVLTVCILAYLLLGPLSPPASGVTVIWKAANADVTLGLPSPSLEFEDPAAVGRIVKGYTVIDWLDADYNKAGHPLYDEWTVSSPGFIDGNINEIWMRDSSHSIWTTTTQPSRVVSIHMTGDNNDGQAEVFVDGVTVAILDMGSAGLPQTALVIVKNLAPVTHTILIKDAGVGPISRLGDDVHTFGAAALQTNQVIKWWPHYWFLNGRIRLNYTGGMIGTPTGFYWGWYPYYWYGHYWYPWYGPAGWYEPYCYYWYRPYWDSWPWYRYYRPWWHYWRWRGGWTFWGFNDYLYYNYWYWQPRTIYYWSWYWDPQGQGGCMELVTQADEQDPSGERILPFPDPCIPGFAAGAHEYSVNGGKVTGTFSQLEFIPVSSLETYYQSIPGVTADDVQLLMRSDIVQRLMANPQGYIGVQHAMWTHPLPAIQTDADIPEVRMTEGSTTGSEYTFTVSLTQPPTALVAEVDVVSSDVKELTIDGVSPDGVLRLYFDPTTWDIPQPVTIRTVPDAINEEEHKVMVAAFLAADMTEGFSLDVLIQDSGCGGFGYNASDLNQDCNTNFLDFALFADEWLYSTVPTP